MRCSASLHLLPPAASFLFFDPSHCFCQHVMCSFYSGWPHHLARLIESEAMEPASRQWFSCVGRLFVFLGRLRDFPRTQSREVAFLLANCYAGLLHYHLVHFLSARLPRFVPQVSSHLLVSRDEEFPLPIMPPRQDTNLLRVPARRFEFGLGVEVFEQETDSRFHSIPF